MSDVGTIALTMTDREQELKLITAQLQSLRAETIEMQKAMHQVMFAFLTVTAAIGGLWSQEKPLTEPLNRDILIFALTQIEFFLGTFAVSLYLNQSVHTGYIAALEEEANLRLGKRLFVWDSDITREFIASFKSRFFWSVGILATFLFVTLGTLSYLVLQAYQSIPVHIVIVLELGALSLLGYLATAEHGRVKTFARERLGICPETGSKTGCEDNPLPWG